LIATGGKPDATLFCSAGGFGAHRAEHAAEWSCLPAIAPAGLRFVPIALGTAQFEPLEQLGMAIADVIAAQKQPVLIVASSDRTTTNPIQ